MKKIITTLCVLFSVLALSGQSLITGVWNLGTDNTKVEITADSNVCSGAVVASDNTNLKIGTAMLRNLQYVRGTWRGEMYSPKNQKWYPAALEGNGDELEISVKAGLITKTLNWRRD
ncbi:MAG: DUF2147 domain-containing protein [Bacteroidota bacterium]